MNSKIWSTESKTYLKSNKNVLKYMSEFENQDQDQYFIKHTNNSLNCDNMVRAIFKNEISVS